MLSPPEFLSDILLSLRAAPDVAGEEAEALRFLERVTTLLVISFMRDLGRQWLKESLLVRVGDVWASPYSYMASSDSMLKLVCIFLFVKSFEFISYLTTGKLRHAL